MSRAFGISGLDAAYKLVEVQVTAESRGEAAEAAKRMGLRHVVVYERPRATPAADGHLASPDGRAPRARRRPHR